MKSTIFAGLILAAASLFAISTANAGDLTGNVGVTSNYENRGLTESDNHGAIFGGLDYTAGKAYVGTWASTADLNDSTKAEVDLYAGYRPVVGNYTFDLGVVYYGYIDQPRNSNYAYGEVKAAVSRPVGAGAVGASVYYSPNFFANTGKAYYYEVNASYPLTSKLSLSGALGEQAFLTGSKSYTTGNIGVTYAVANNLSFDVRYVGTNAQEEGHTVLTLKANF